MSPLQSFKMWKETKDAKIIENERKKKKMEEEKRLDEQEKVRDKERHSARAYDKW